LPEIDTVHFCHDIVNYAEEGYDGLDCGSLVQDRLDDDRLG